MNKFKTILASMAAALNLFAAAALAATPELPPGASAIVDVWPGTAPGSETWTQKEQVTLFGFEPETFPVTRNVVKPTLTVFLPDPPVATGAAAIVAPGGGFRFLTMEAEGYDVARWLTAHGVAALVLKYRTVETPAEDAAFLDEMKQMFMKSMNRDTPLDPLDMQAQPGVADAVQAMKVLNAHAGQWNIDPARTGLMGFSAGARVTSGAMLDEHAPGLAFAGLIYGGPFGEIPSLPSSLPPVFLAVAQDDPLARNPVTRFEAALTAAGHSAELHLYSGGSHGFGMRHLGTSSDHWIDEFFWWLEARGVTGKPVAVPPPPPFRPTPAAGTAGQAPVMPVFDVKAMQAAMEAYDKMPDTAGTGKYPALKEVLPALPDHVVYRPADLAKLGEAKLGVLAWGNGGCAADGAGARLHLAEIASHGYLAIASGKILSGPGAPPRAERPMPSPGSPIPPPATEAASLTEAIDWALAENARPGSPYFGRIKPDWIAVSGWSCGGLQALQVAADPRVRTVIIHNSGIFSDGSNPIPGLEINKAALKNLHTPIIYILGGPTDIAYANGMDDYQQIEGVPAMVANLDVGHGGTFLQPNGGRAASVAVSWLDWKLKGDNMAAARFTGADCGLCADPDWKVERKNMQAGAQ